MAEIKKREKLFETLYVKMMTVRKKKKKKKKEDTLQIKHGHWIPSNDFPHSLPPGETIRHEQQLDEAKKSGRKSCDLFAHFGCRHLLDLQHGILVLYPCLITVFCLGKEKGEGKK